MVRFLYSLLANRPGGMEENPYSDIEVSLPPNYSKFAVENVFPYQRIFMQTFNLMQSGNSNSLRILGAS